MRSPEEMKIIQIDITNACIHQCSNCTRFCGHHKKPFFMDWETFKRAVASLQGYDAIIGIMGGEPTLHPQFERFTRYLSQEHPPHRPCPALKGAIPDFNEFIRDCNRFYRLSKDRWNGPGLWSSVTEQYKKHFELIQESFVFQNINDHQNISLHQPILISRKELGISDEEWFPMRDNCWIQNKWSATITPKGAFFCEIAGALDMLLDGPGGWEIEPGWWKRKPSEFGEQLKWCEICGGALLHEGRLSSEEIDDVSPAYYEKLKKMGSPKLKAGRVKIFDMESGYNPMPETDCPYLPPTERRVAQDNDTLLPHFIDLILENPPFEIKEKVFDSMLLFEQDNQDAIQMPQRERFGAKLEHAIYQSHGDWICFVRNAEIPYKIAEELRHTVLNPGEIYMAGQEGKALFFHPSANALKKAGLDGLCQCEDLESFLALWPEQKRIILPDSFKIRSSRN